MEPHTTTASTTAAAKVDIAPNYGLKKVRIGVQQKDKSDVPATSTTVGTKITITETGPDLPKPQVTNCVTAAGSRVPGDAVSASFCDFAANSRVANLARRQPRAIIRPEGNGPVPFTQGYYILPGSTLVITQDSVNAGYVVDPASPVTLKPCENPPPAGRAAAAAPTCSAQQVILENGGLPPIAADDIAKTKEGQAVTIAIAPNDTPKASITAVTIVGDPKHGTARLVTAPRADASSPQNRQVTSTRRPAATSTYHAVYTPKAGFTGIDSFRYTIRTANGTATATVTVRVTGIAAPSSASASPASNARDGLADTGTRTGELAGYAAALLATGGGALALGRQRRRGRHAR